jgi:histidinol-phosphate/aromatic aminotransferase/cobyric acid decarboxylase-like protein
MRGQPVTTCRHGGAFFEAIGQQFDDLDARHRVINADVLDAWFEPAPAVLEALGEHLPWLIRTSPPTRCEGLVEAIAAARGIEVSTIVPGAGSSDLIFRALRRWRSRISRALVLDPMYGEYAHVLERVVGCRVERMVLDPATCFDIDVDAMHKHINRGVDLVVIVNPNSPTGRWTEPRLLCELIERHPHTLFWIDETYVEYIGSEHSLELFACNSTNVVVCKSMSKVYALSGMRVGYLCGNETLVGEVERVTPPWVVGLAAQVAAVAALKSPDYYEAQYEKTHELRQELARMLEETGMMNVVEGTASFVLARLIDERIGAARLVKECKQRGVFIRDAFEMGKSLGDHYIRIAVKEARTNAVVAQTISSVLATPLASSSSG